METRDDNEIGRTAKERQVAWIQYEFDKPGKYHPGLILDRNGEILRVVSGTSQDKRDGQQGFVKVEGGVGLNKTTYFQTTKVYEVSDSSVGNIAGEMPEDVFRDISERTEGL